MNQCKYLVVGDFYSATDNYYQHPFSGDTGDLIRKMFSRLNIPLGELGFECIVHQMPPNGKTEAWWSKKKPANPPGWGRLPGGWVHPEVWKCREEFWKRVRNWQAEAILVLSDPAFQLLGGEGSCDIWRGSNLRWEGTRMIPSFPAVFLRIDPSRKDILFHDIERLTQPEVPEPEYQFILDPSYSQVLATLSKLLAQVNSALLWLDLDIETTAQHITCLGLAYSSLEAICIPFTTNGLIKPRWDQEQEVEIVWLLKQLLTHPNVRISGQNLFYDFQLIHHHWLFIPNFAFDTMLTHHVLFPWLRKSLAFQTSIYSPHYKYWKEMHRSKKGEEKDEA